MKQIEDWNKVDENMDINVPDHLDKMVNNVGNQFNLVNYSGKNTAEAACDIVYGLEKFFIAKFEDEKKEMLEACHWAKGFGKNGASHDKMIVDKLEKVIEKYK